MWVNLRWPGADTLRAARKAIRDGSPVEIELPLEMHYSLYRQLHPEAGRGPAEDVDASGGAELLEPIAAIAGLEDLRALQPALRRARYRLRITSPQPVLLRLQPPERAKKTSSARRAAGC